VPYPHPVHTPIYYLSKLRLHHSFLCGYSTVTSSALFISPMREMFVANDVTVITVDEQYES
jgi:hypothetical protein